MVRAMHTLACFSSRAINRNGRQPLLHGLRPKPMRVDCAMRRSQKVVPPRGRIRSSVRFVNVSQLAWPGMLVEVDATAAVAK